VKSLSRITALGLAATIMLPQSSASAQRPAPTPEQRIERLERQLQQMQRQVFPKGRPADTAGFSDEPAATQSSVVSLDQRLDAIERQMADLVRQSEESGNRLRGLESDFGNYRAAQDQRLASIEQRLAAAPVVPGVQPPEAVFTTPSQSKPKSKPSAGPSTAGTPTGTADETAAATPAGDPGEDAYTEGFHLWEGGNYDAAISSLRAFTAAYPKHRRVSYANNLIGRALLDKGQANAAAQALLANYRTNPQGERAADSLYYLGQALMKLNQPGQACKAYAELDAVYGSKVRADLRKLVNDGKAQAQCN